ncbi:MAG TPA: ATP-binding cassette domain-containing protein [Cyclobacteriaceae bacterium]|nr:ATP-binding cassette domain-containing protein [Cyclobacteriaceae bacterium]HPW60730.1 ATP-binding cassette domain-containing protein [Cyclobacteriaceae bacterium]
MIKTDSLSYSYGTEKKIQFSDLTIQTGEQFLLLGESGSGKTTLLHLLGGLLKSQQGSIEVNGTDITKLSESGLDRFRGQHYGFIFQRNHLIGALSVERNLLMAPFLAGLKQNLGRVEEVLSQLGIAEKRRSRIQDLSLGQAQRVAIARAVLNKPSVILADEPTSALDDKNCDRVSDLLLSLADKNKATLIIATHDQRLKDKVKNLIHL